MCLETSPVDQFTTRTVLVAKSSWLRHVSCQVLVLPPSTALTGQHNTQSVLPSVLSHMWIVPSKMKITCNCCFNTFSFHLLTSEARTRLHCGLGFPSRFHFQVLPNVFFLWGLFSPARKTEQRTVPLWTQRAGCGGRTEKTHTHTHQRQFLFNLKFMHSFIEQLYKILLIVASACLICQQIWSLNYKKQGFMSCSELLGHLSSS